VIKVKGKILNIGNYTWEKLGLELIVVFLGVTSGFLLNNWRTHEQEKELEQKYISGFSDDVTFNIKELRNAVKWDSVWLACANPLLLSIRGGTISLDSSLAAMKLILRLDRIDLHTGTYEDITNSGNLNIINDFNLKSLIIDYHIAVQGLGFMDDYFSKYFSDFVMPFIFSECNVLTQQFKDPEIIKSTRFSNVIAGYYSMIQQRRAAFSGLLLRAVH
jgi:hypothetical protein